MHNRFPTTLKLKLAKPMNGVTNLNVHAESVEQVGIADRSS